MPMQCMICLLKVCAGSHSLSLKPRESRGSRIGPDRRLRRLCNGKTPIYMLALQLPHIGTVVWHQKTSPRNRIPHLQEAEGSWLSGLDEAHG